MTNWTGGILHRYCVLKQVIEGNIQGKIEVTGRRGIRSKQLRDGLKETGGFRKLRAKYQIVLCGKDNEPVVRQLRNELIGQKNNILEICVNIFLQKHIYLSVTCAIIMLAYTFYQTLNNSMTTFKQTDIHISMQNLLL
jgi:hypothetical protein